MLKAIINKDIVDGMFSEDFSTCGDRMRPGMLARQTLGLGCFILNNQDNEDDEKE